MRGTIIFRSAHDNMKGGIGMTSDAARGQHEAVQARPLTQRPAARTQEGAQAAALADHDTLPTEYVDGVRGIAAFYVVLNHARFLLFISAATALALSAMP